MGSSGYDREALVILVGITADEFKRQSVLQFFTDRSPFETFLPKLRQWMGVRAASWALHKYLETTVGGGKYARVHFLNYISGGVMFRYVANRWSLPNVGRVVYDRGPIQEEVPVILVRKYWKLPLMIGRGKMLTDLSGDWLDRLPFPPSDGEQGLLVERGVSALAQSLHLSSDSIPAERWNHDRLLPGAHDVLAVPESHDDVYTSPKFLSAALGFLQHGAFKYDEATEGQLLNHNGATSHDRAESEVPDGNGC